MNGKRQLQKEQTRERIIVAARKVYSERGFSAPTSDIANEAGISHGSIFVHFPTVEDLLVNLLDSFSDDISKELHILAESGGSIERLLSMHIDVLIDHENFYKRLVTEAALLPEEARNTFIAMQSMVSIHFLQVLKQEMSSEKARDIPHHMIFNTWIGLIHYYLLNSELFVSQGSVLTEFKNDLIKCFTMLIK